MLPTDAQLISVDDHIIEPPHLWQDRLPEKYRASGPRVVELDDGTEAWVFEDQVVQTVRGNTRTRPGCDDDPLGIARFSEMRPGCYEPKARLADMDEDGIWAQLCFPDFSRFAGHRFIACQDRTLANLCIEAYNDFVLDEWCAADPRRLMPLTLVTLWDVQYAAREAARVAERGARGIAFSENPTVLGLPSLYSSHWDPLWEVVNDTGLVVCLHVGSSSKLIKSSDDAPFSSVLPLVGVNSMVACTDWLLTGVLDRYPNIRVAFSEGGAGWVPYLLEQAEDTFHSYASQFGTTRPPREVFAEHMFVCFIRDRTALSSIEVIGEDRIMWESDYPHDSTTFPNSRQRLEDALREIPDETARRIVETNARALFRIP